MTEEDYRTAWLNAEYIFTGWFNADYIFTGWWQWDDMKLSCEQEREI